MENILRLYNQKNAAGKNAKMPPEQRASPALWTFSDNLFFFHVPMYTCFDFSEKHIFLIIGIYSTLFFYLKLVISGLLSRHPNFYYERARRFQQMSKSIPHQPTTTRPTP